MILTIGQRREYLLPHDLGSELRHCHKLRLLTQKRALFAE